MSNSSLVEFTKLSPHNSGKRTAKIDTITPHMVWGQTTIGNLGNWFSIPSTQASSNYGIDKDGRIGMFVPEGSRSWCTSSGANDQRAVTIEIASDQTAPYKMNPKAIQSLIKLVADICKRNGIPKLLWKNNKSLIGKINEQNITLHQWFASTACPGAFLISQLNYVADEVNKLLGASNPAQAPDKKDVDTIAKEVISGKWGNWPDRQTALEKAGYVYKDVQDRVDKLMGKPGTTPEQGTFKSYLIKVNVGTLNYRSGPSIDYTIVGNIQRNGIYTIVEEKKGSGATMWGRLKSGAGWISLDHVKKV